MTFNIEPLSEQRLTHLRQLESESIYIFREVVAEFNNPTKVEAGRECGLHTLRN